MELTGGGNVAVVRVTIAIMLVGWDITLQSIVVVAAQTADM
jgi:hypothetical protein